jgi:hypothetical protein
MNRSSGLYVSTNQWKTNMYTEISNITRATRCNNPEDTILHSHRRENLKSYNKEESLQRLGYCNLEPKLTGILFKRHRKGRGCFLVNIIETIYFWHTLLISKIRRISTRPLCCVWLPAPNILSPKLESRIMKSNAACYCRMVVDLFYRVCDSPMYKAHLMFVFVIANLS